MKTDARDEALLEDIAGYFDILASDSEAFAARGMGKRENATRAKVWRQAAADVRSIELLPRADLAQAPAPVRVKALEWSLADWNQSEGSEESALSSFGRYYVKSGASYWGPGVILSHGYHSLTGAKAAAQADYEARILAALEAPDAGVVAELVEALRGLFGLLDAGSLYEPQAYRAREVLAKLGGKANG